MQLLPSLSQGPQTVRRERSAGVHLPYARHVDDHTIETRDGLLMQTLRLRGLLFETADTAELNYRKALRDAMLRAVGTSRFAIYHHIVRRRIEPDLDAVFPDAFSQTLNDAWATRLSGRRLYVNDLYVTLIRRPLQGGIGMLAARSALGEAAVNADDLLNATLRMRPDRVILGELRGPEAYTFLRAVNTGHPGSMTTVHADSPERAIEQIALLVLQGGSRLRRDDVVHYIRSTIDLFVQLKRVGGRRSVSEIRLRSAL